MVAPGEPVATTASSYVMPRYGEPFGYEFVRAAIDDHTRLAYAEVDPDERAEACAGSLRSAAVWFAAHSFIVEHVMTDNALACRRSCA